jgi:hypothetical protein
MLVELKRKEASRVGGKRHGLAAYELGQDTSKRRADAIRHLSIAGAPPFIGK